MRDQTYMHSSWVIALRMTIWASGEKVTYGKTGLKHRTRKMNTALAEIEEWLTFRQGIFIGHYCIFIELYCIFIEYLLYIHLTLLHIHWTLLYIHWTLLYIHWTPTVYETMTRCFHICISLNWGVNTGSGVGLSRFLSRLFHLIASWWGTYLNSLITVSSPVKRTIVTTSKNFCGY